MKCIVFASDNAIRCNGWRQCQLLVWLAGIEPQPCASVLLMPGSLLVFNQEAYSGCLHGIAEVQTASVSPTFPSPDFVVALRLTAVITLQCGSKLFMVPYRINHNLSALHAHDAMCRYQP